MSIINRRLYRELRALAVALVAAVAAYGILWANVLAVLISTWMALGILLWLRYDERRHR